MAKVLSIIFQSGSSGFCYDLLLERTIADLINGRTPQTPCGMTGEKPFQDARVVFFLHLLSSCGEIHSAAQSASEKTGRTKDVVKLPHHRIKSCPSSLRLSIAESK